MKITFKDGRSITNISSISITNIKRSSGYSPMVNIIFNKGVGFTDVQDIITQENVAEMIIETDDKEVTRTLTGFNKVYMSENISDVSYSFVVSVEKQDPSAIAEEATASETVEEVVIDSPTAATTA